MKQYLIIFITCLAVSGMLLSACASQQEQVKTEKASAQKDGSSFIVSGLSAKEIVEQIVKKTTKPYKVTQSDPTKGTVTLSKGVSLTSWGENYPIKVEKISESECRVEVDFHRIYALQVTGGGQHKKCIDYLKRILLK